MMTLGYPFYFSHRNPEANGLSSQDRLGSHQRMPGPAELPTAGHFVQEQGEIIARRARVFRFDPQPTIALKSTHA